MTLKKQMPSGSISQNFGLIFNEGIRTALIVLYSVYTDGDKGNGD